MKPIVTSLAALAALALSPAAHAQDAAASVAAPAPSTALNQQGLLPAAAADGCELHLWPAERMSSQTSGLLGPGLLSSAINGKRDSSNQSLMASALDSPSQLNALTSLDLRNLLNRSPGTTIVLHETALERHTMNKIKTNIAAFMMDNSTTLRNFLFDKVISDSPPIPQLLADPALLERYVRRY